MKKTKQFWAIIAFGILSAAPFVPVATNLIKIRSAMISDQPITWVEGSQKIVVPQLNKGTYELRLESTVSDWQPTVKVAFGLKELQTAREIMPISNPEEIILTRPIAKLHIQENTAGENELTIIFANSNPVPDKNAVRIKLSRDRDTLLAETTREFSIVLAISLVLMVFLWKPLMTPPRPDAT